MALADTTLNDFLMSRSITMSGLNAVLVGFIRVVIVQLHSMTLATVRVLLMDSYDLFAFYQYAKVNQQFSTSRISRPRTPLGTTNKNPSVHKAMKNNPSHQYARTTQPPISSPYSGNIKVRTHSLITDRSKLDHQLGLLPETIHFHILHPILVLLDKFEVKVEDYMSKDETHFDVCQILAKAVAGADRESLHYVRKVH